ncbi:MAG: hypothetical protein QOJ77_12, partial [Microbacteriaceae bacterium]|nr:hypothetical protein [Microbacteriaceae bacterium]
AFAPRIVHVDAANRVLALDSDAASAVAPGLERAPHAL